MPSGEYQKRNIYQKIQKIMESIHYLKADKTIKLKSGDSYNVISSQKIFTIIRDLMKKNSLVFIPKYVESDIISITPVHSTNGGVILGGSILTTIRMTVEVIDNESGEYFSVQGVGQGADTQDKGASKAITNAYKNLMQKLFLIPIGDDPDEYDSDDLDNELRENASKGNNPIPITEEKKPSERVTDKLIGAILTEFQLNTNKDMGECRRLFISPINGCQKLSEIPSDQYPKLINLVKDEYLKTNVKHKTPSLDSALKLIQ